MPFVKKTLERILGEERFDRLKDKGEYKFYVEAFAMNTFSYAFAAPIELLWAGMDFKEHIYTRLAGVVANTLLGRPYGIARDWIFKKLGITSESHWLKKYAGDTLAFAALQMPVYCINMAIAGAEIDEIVNTLVPTTLMIGAIGRPYGAYLDWTRRQCGIEPEYVTTDK
jgi:hypothetical protein